MERLMKVTDDTETMAGSVKDGEIVELLLDATTDGIMDWDLSRSVVRYTPRWKLLLGYEVNQLVDSPLLWRELSHPEDWPRVEEALADHFENFWPFTQTWRMKHANGDWRWVLCRAVSSRGPDGAPLRLIAVFSDITDRIRAEERHRALTEAIPDLLLRVKKDGTLLDVKPASGEPPQGLAWPVAGQSLSSWAPAHDWHERVTSAIVAGQAATTFEVSLGDGEARRFADVRVVPSVEDEALCIVRDVTEQRRLQAQLMQAHKLESIGQLAAGIAHEINTPMQFIGDNLSFLKEASSAFLTLIETQQRALEAARERPVADEEVVEIENLREELDFAYLAEKGPSAVAAALDGVKRVANIVSAMKEFSHPGKLEKSMADLNRELETTITISTNVWKYLAEIERKFDVNLPLVPCHAGEINQVVLNLIVNAAHAIGDVTDNGRKGKGVITISTGTRGRFAEIRVSDTGTGIPDNIRERIFDPFFTTKEVGRGTGQGLAIARTTVVDKHGGTLDLETDLGKGTTFIVRLPLVAANPG
jgi:PAS domain S-box-containing protein